MDGVIDLTSQIENTRDPEVLTDVLHFEEHSREIECLLQSVKNAYADAASFVERLQPFWQVAP